MTLQNMSNNNQQEFSRILEEKERLRQQIVAENRKASAPVLLDLAKMGFSLNWIGDLYTHKMNYRRAIPILLKWLPLVDNLDVKEDIIRALTVRWAKPIAAQPLIAEFRKLQNESNTGIKWAIANALTEIADDSVFSDIVELVQDQHNGNSREMLALALGNMKNQNAADILINLLDDEVVVGHAIIGLGKLKSAKAIPKIERFKDHPKTWIRNEAKKAILKIEKAGKK